MGGFDGDLIGKGPTHVFLNSVHVKMIDFAHFQDRCGDQPDHEYLFGLNSLRLHLEMLMDAPITDEGPLQVPTLASPPAPDMQNGEQERAWEALQSELPRPKPFSEEEA